MPMHTLTREQSAQRRARILDLRRQRLPWDVIGAEFDITPQRAHQIYKDALAEFPVAKLEAEGYGAYLDQLQSSATDEQG